jgi:hypothetical protein
MMNPADLIATLEGSGLADLIRENDNLFPLIESVHVLAISLVVGSIVAVDLRLLGLAWTRRAASGVTGGILPLTWTAFVVAASSGSLLFISHATKYLANAYFDTKLLLIVLAGINMLAFQFFGARDQAQWDARVHPPLKVRAAGGISIALWVAIVACGRWIGFTIEAG